MSMARHAAMLGGFAFVCTAAIVLVQTLTAPRIQAEQDAAFGRLLAEVLPLSAYNNTIARDCTVVEDADTFGRSNAVIVYRARRDGAPAALVFSATAPDGYSGDIDLLIALYPDQRIAGVRVTAHQETPGLGDKIERRKDDWIDQFRGLSLSQPAEAQWTVRKDGGDFDAFTGATITPRAIVKGVRRTLEFCRAQRERLFRPADA